MAEEQDRNSSRQQVAAEGLTGGLTSALRWLEVVVGLEVDEFLFGEFLWRYVGAEHPVCGQRSGVN